MARFVEESQAGAEPVGAPPPLPRADRRAAAARADPRRAPRRGRASSRGSRTCSPTACGSITRRSDRAPGGRAGCARRRSPTSFRARSTSRCRSTRWGPAAHAMERVVVEWMTEKVGWPAGSGGVLTHGGSLANLTVLLAARAAAAPDAWVEGVDGTLAVLAPPVEPLLGQAQRRDARAGRAGGRGPRGGRARADRARPRSATRSSGARRRVAGRWRWWRPRAPPAPGCTTTWRRSARSAASTAIWFHVDAAHGATALLSPEHRHLLEGHRARRLGDLGRPQDDAHAGARRRGAAARRAPARGGLPPEGGYLIYEDSSGGASSLLERQVECTKAALGMRIFMNLAFRGEDGSAATSREQYDKTRRFHDLIAARPGLRVPVAAGVEHPLLPPRPRPGPSRCWLRERLLAEQRLPPGASRRR